MRKFISFILSTVICFSATTLPASAVDFQEIQAVSVKNDSSEVLEYVMANRSEIWIAGMTAEAENIVIPEYVDGLPVVGIESYSFGNSEYSSSIKSVVIPKTVKYIGEGAFSYCQNIESLTISDGVEHIGGFAFVGCSKLKNVTIPKSVRKIGDMAFNGCDSIEEFVIESPDCDIYCMEYTIYSGTYGDSIIVGYDNSSAQKYAEIYNKKFKSLGTSPTDFNICDFEYPYKKLLIELMYQDSNSYMEYWLYDIDKDNVPELITKTGTSESDYIIKFYKYKDNEVILIDSMSGGHATFYKDKDNKQLCYMYGHMGYGDITWLSFDGNSISVDRIVENVGYDEKNYVYKWSDYGNFETLESSYAFFISYADGWSNELDMSLISNYKLISDNQISSVIIPSDKVGNVNGDDIIDANDASVILSTYVLFSTGEISVLSDEQCKTADVNGDGLVDANDASAILGYYSYLSTLPSTETPVDIKEYITK
ncbi:MAG: leucine-rich repeat protein [Ruminococcus sp.]|nr:leucine-rich repeat protein [Ruminococcus sp.]